jgi:hypothetical protein
MGQTKMKLSNPRVAVIMVDGSEWEAQTLNIDLVKWERTAAKHKWPDFREAPLTWMTFLAWSAGQRGGQIASTVTWEQFSGELCAQVSEPGADEGGTVVPPTGAAADID